MAYNKVRKHRMKFVNGSESWNVILSCNWRDCNRFQSDCSCLLYFLNYFAKNTWFLRGVMFRSHEMWSMMWSISYPVKINCKYILFPRPEDEITEIMIRRYTICLIMIRFRIDVSVKFKELTYEFFCDINHCRGIFLDMWRWFWRKRLRSFESLFQRWA